MVEKITVEIVLPVLGKTLEFFTPMEMHVKDFYSLVLKMISGDYPELDDDLAEIWFVDVSTQKMLPENATCREAGLRSGSRLMLMHLNQPGQI